MNAYAAQLTVQWQDNTPNETGFVIERGTDGINFTPIFTTARNATSYADNGVQPAITYYYRIKAINSSGESAYSAVASGSTDVPIITSASTASVTYRNSFSYTITTNIAATSYAVANGTLPAGITLDQSTGIISGAPTVSGVFVIGLTASNSSTGPESALTITVNPKNLTVTGIAGGNKAYDATTAGFLTGTASLQAAEATATGSPSDGKPYTGDVVSVSGNPTAIFASTSVANNIGVTVSGFTLTGAQSANYTITQPTGFTANITPKFLNPSGLATSNKVYDATTTAALTGTAVLLASESPGAGTSIDGKPYTGDAVSLSGTASAAFSDRNVGNAKPVTVSGLTLTGAQAANYQMGQPPSFTANITAKTLPVSGLTASNRVYDATIVATFTGTAALQAAEAPGAGTSSDGKPYTGDTVSLAGAASGSFADRNIGTGKAVTVTGFTLSGAQAINYTIAQPTGLTANISVKSLTFPGLAINNKIYDATNAATFTTPVALQTAEAPGAGTFSDGKPYTGDTVALGGAVTATFDTQYVNNGKAVTVSTITLTGAQANNYAVTQPVGLTANVTQKALTASGLTASNKVYDGTTTASVTGTAVLLAAEAQGSGSTSDGKPYNGDAVSLTGAGTFAFADRHAGTAKPISITGLSLAGADSSNYSLSSTSVTANITAKALTIAGLTANPKVYDGTTAATLTGTAALQAAEATGTGTTADGKPYTGDTISLGGTNTGTFADKNVGTNKSVSITGLTIGGAQGADYSVAAGALTANITAAPLTVTADAKTKVSGDALPLFTATITGFVNSETSVTAGVTGSPVLSTIALSTSSAGSYPITVTIGTLAAPNYAFTTFTDGTLTVTAAPPPPPPSGGGGGGGGGGVVITPPASAAPVITTNPVSATVTIGGSATFSMGATGAPGPTIQWKKDGSDIPGANGPSLALSNITLADAGTYSATATNSLGSATTSGAVLTVNGGTAPAFTVQPISQTIATGANVSLSVTVTGAPAPTLQWQKNGSAISGATGSSLTLTNVTAADAGTYTVVATNSVGTATSTGAVVAVTSLPIIVSQPASQTVSFGANVTFSVTVTSNPAATFQWRKNGAAMAGATGSSLSLSNVQAGDAGAYDIIVTNPSGSVTSSPGVLVVNPSTFVGQYFGTLSNGGTWALTVRANNTATFIAYLRDSTSAIVVDLTVSADGAFTVTGTSIVPQASSSSVSAAGSFPRAAAGVAFTLSGTIANGQVSGQLSGLGATLTGAKDAGSNTAGSGFFQSTALGTNAGSSYAIVGPSGQALIVTTMATSVDSATGTVGSNGSLTTTSDRGAAVTAAVDPQALTISTNYRPAGSTASTTFAGTSDEVAANSYLSNISVRSNVGGSNAALIAGFVVSGPSTKQLLLRGIGPTLGSFGVAGALADPTLTLSAGTTTTTNDDWGTLVDPAQITNLSARLGAFALAAASRDAVLLPTLSAGSYTAQVDAKGTATGVALIELYDAAAAETRLVNVSARTMVGTGNDVLIAGFVVAGNAPKRVLIRGIGPGLARFGVSGTLADPTLAISSGSTTVASNDNWGNTADLRAAFDQVAAFALDATSRDAALVVTLQPGAYTAVLSGVGNTTGVALVELYELQ